MQVIEEVSNVNFGQTQRWVKVEMENEQVIVEEDESEQSNDKRSGLIVVIASQNSDLGIERQ